MLATLWSNFQRSDKYIIAASFAVAGKAWSASADTGLEVKAEFAALV